MRTIRRFVAASVTTTALTALLIGDLAARSAEDFAKGWRVGLD